MTYPTSDILETEVDNVDDVMAQHVNELRGAASEMNLRYIKNTSGATVAVGTLGYINHAGEFQTTNTAYLDVIWAVVIVGGANNAKVVVAVGGSGIKVLCNGNAAVGDFLYTSTTVGQAQPLSTMRPEMFAIVTTANAAGAGGTCEALLHCNTKPVPKAPTENIYYGTNLSISDFVATIATLPGGAVLTYNAPTSGDEANIVPQAATYIAKMVLHNTTRSNDALINEVVIGTNTITLTAAVPGDWIVTDTITMRSQTNTTQPTAGAYFADFEFVSDLSALARYMVVTHYLADTSAANIVTWYHPYQANVAAKRRALRTQVANLALDWVSPPIPIFESRFCLAWNASGANTITHSNNLAEEGVAAP